MCFVWQPRRWPDLSLKSPGIKPRGSRGHHLPALQSLDSLLNSLSNSQIEESIADDSQTHSPSTPQTPPYSATSCGAGSDHSVFAQVFIGGGGFYPGPSPTTPISTPPTPNPWSSMPGLPPNPSTPPPLPPRTNRTGRHSNSQSSDLSSPRSRFAPSFVPMANSYDDSSPPPLPPRCATFSTLPRNCSHSGAGNHIIQRLNSEITLPRRNSALELPITQNQLPRRFSQSGQHAPMSPPPPPPNSTPVFLPPSGPPGPQLPPKTYRQTLNNIAR